MDTPSILQLVLYAVLLTLCVKPLGLYMARVYQHKSTPLDRVLGPVERIIYRIGGVSSAEMHWKQYALAVLAFHAAGFVILYLLQRVQGLLPLNPAGLPAVPPHLAFNSAVSFVTNTNWQSYGGETTLSYLVQMLGLTVQNFVSAAVGMAVLVVLIRGIVRRETQRLGNFWVDLTRTTLYILLPLALIVSGLLASQGVVQTFSPYAETRLVEAGTADDGTPITTQTLALGPAASQVAIKQLGTNGGGFFNVNSSHPFENPTPFSNLVEMFSILLIAAALCYTFGEMAGNRREGWMLYSVMLVFLALFTAGTYICETQGTPALAVHAGAAGNLEGKEVRFGIANSVLWANATTAASNGSVNSMHDSYTPIGGLFPMWFIELGEVIFGGVGSGLYGMLMFVILTVFIAGLMVGRTPEYLGKKVGVFEMKMASVAILSSPLVVLILTAVALSWPGQTSSIQDPGAHGFSEILYNFSSAGNNNGSAFAGFNANTPFYNTTLGIAMLIGRFVTLTAVIAVAGALAQKRFTPASVGTLRTDTPLFGALLGGVVLAVGALSFLPALALGPIAELLTQNAVLHQ